jgi:D-arabinose 1-dehydrogenase-like Zn-dependent alcohol dehydrogenase
VIAGHEPCGVVAAVGPGVNERQAKVGDRVMCHHYKGCGVCHHCRVGWSQLCVEGIVVYGVTGHGAHAPWMKVPASTLVPLPDELSFETGAAISCGTGTAYGALRRMQTSGRETIAIFGQGPVGLGDPARRSHGRPGDRTRREPGAPRACEGIGAAATINPKADDPIAAIKQLTHGLVPS